MKKISYLTLPILITLLPISLFLWFFTPANVAAGACSVPGDHATIQAAANDNTCNTINVSAATYNENVAITRSVTIIGAGPASTFVDGGGVGSVFTIDPGLTIHLESLAIQNGMAVDGGGIHNTTAALTLSNTQILNNSAGNAGGGLFNAAGQITIFNSQIQVNNANFGGGVYNQTGSIDIIEADFIDNETAPGGAGGGLYHEDGNVNIESSVFSDNETPFGHGGGIYQANISATLQITNSAFERNISGNDGGGIHISGGTTAVNGSSFQENVADSDGGGLYNGGVGSLSVQNSQFLTNSAVVGGGLANRGIITVSQSLFQGNAAVDQIPTFGEGGGLYNSGTALVETSHYVNNHAFSYGGGLINIGDLTVRQTTVDDNFVMSGTGFGGGIGNSGVLALDSSTVSHNNAIDGGGIFNLWMLTMINSTISGNNANGGGGLQNRGPVQIHYSTFISNTALAGGGILVLSGTVTLNSAIVALSPGGSDCFVSGGTIVSNDYNIDSDNTCNLTQPNDLPATPPLLGPLQDNGGWTFTHALLPGSPGIDSGDPGTCPTGDQRGFPRPFGPACDIGSYEVGMVVYLPIVRKP